MTSTTNPAMPDQALQPLTRPIDATLTPPGSKSLTNRALVLAALSAGPCTLTNVLFAEDTHVMLQALTQLGFAPQVDRARRHVHLLGRAGEIPAPAADLHCGNSGTTLRFLTALCCLGRGNFTLDGVPRMRQRPVGPLVRMLRNLGARIEHTNEDGYPPLRITAGSLPGGFVRFGASSSSQYLSALAMAAPYTRFETRIDLDPDQTSWPYVAMTLRLMDHFGHTPELLKDRDTGQPRQLVVPRGTYAPTHYSVEPDASSASYFFALAAVHPGSRVTVRGLRQDSLQGDVGFVDLLARMGAIVEHGPDFIRVTGPDSLGGIDADLSTMPDVAQTLAVTALFAVGPTTLRGLHTLRVKETDRIAALQAELTRLGGLVQVEGDTLCVHPPRTVLPGSIDTYDDHRMAMSFAVAGTRAHGIVIRDAHCVAKSYPGFFDDLRDVIRSA